MENRSVFKDTPSKTNVKKIEVPTEFQTAEDDTKTLAKKVMKHIAIGFVVFATLCFTYVVWEQKSHQAKVLVIEGATNVLQADIPHLRAAEQNFLKAREAYSFNEHATAGLAEVYTLLWLEHGLTSMREPAEIYLNKAKKHETSERYMAEILFLLGDGQVNEAVKLGQDLIQKNIVSEKIYYATGLAERALGQFKNGRDHLRMAYEKRKSATLYAAALGDAYDADNDKASASHMWEVAANAGNTVYVPSVAHAALASIRRGSPIDKAQADILRLNQLAAENLGVHDKAALSESTAALLWYQGKPNEALAVLTNGLEAAPNEARLTLLQGQMLVANGQTELGLKALNNAYVKGLGAARYLVSYAEALIDSGKSNEALELLEKNKLEKEAFWYVTKAKAHFALNNLSEANKQFELALQLDGHNVSALLGQGRIAQTEKQFPKAQGLFEKAAAVDGQSPEIYEAVGFLWVAMNAPSDAQEQFLTAEKFYAVRGYGVLEMQQFYKRVAAGLTTQKNLQKFWVTKSNNALNV